MIDLGFYERVVAIRSPKSNNMRKVIISALCGLALAVWIACALVMGAGVVACVLISVLIVAVPFVVTSFSANELEYAISADSVTLAMIYNGRRRKEIFWAEADDILLIAPNTEDNRKTAQAYEPREKFSATTESGELDEWLIVFKDEKDEKYLFTFEADAGVQKLLKAIKPSAFKVR